MNESKLIKPEEMIAMATAGRAVLTLQHNDRFTYLFAAPIEEVDGDDGEKRRQIRFVKVLCGPNNKPSSRDYKYAGFIVKKEDGKWHLVHGNQKAKVGMDAQSWKALDWTFRHLDICEEKGVEIRHSGFCMACGRRLTTPASIDRGVGPICAQYIGAY